MRDGVQQRTGIGTWGNISHFGVDSTFLSTVFVGFQHIHKARLAKPGDVFFTPALVFRVLCLLIYFFAKLWSLQFLMLLKFLFKRRRKCCESFIFLKCFFQSLQKSRVISRLIFPFDYVSRCILASECNNHKEASLNQQCWQYCCCLEYNLWGGLFSE